MKLHNVIQGSDQWHALRASTRNASEAPAMMGVSPYKSRSALIREKATGITEEVTPEMQKRFDRGHETEAKARTIVEELFGEELFPMVATDDEGYLLASSDGATMLRDWGFEHKLWNAELAAQIAACEVPESHRWQLDQQIEVIGFEKILFVVSDGTKDNFVHCWYVSTPERAARLHAGWDQFDKDVAAYVPSDIKEMPNAEVTVDLPTLFVHAKGEITTHNMDEFGKALSAKLAETRAIVLVTDQDFSNAKEAAKKFRETAKAIALSKEQMLAQTETIGEAARKMDAWAVDLNKTALQLEKDVDREDKAKKEVMVLGGKNAYAEYIAALESETAPIRLNLASPNFADAIKGKRNYASMQDAVDTMLSGAKVEADAAARDVRSKLAWCKEHAAGHGSLLPDLQQIITKPIDDFALTITSRINKAKADEVARLEAEREKIRTEEQAKAQREANERAAAEQAERNRIAAEEIRKLDEERKASMASSCVEEKPKSETQPVLSIASDTQTATNDCLSRIKLGEICARLGYTVSAEFLSSLGIDPVATDKNAKLYSEASFPTICRKIADHTLAVAFKKAA